jgi:hypothetical protein
MVTGYDAASRRLLLLLYVHVLSARIDARARVLYGYTLSRRSARARARVLHALV